MQNFMPNETTERLEERFELYSLLEKGLDDVKAGRGIRAEQFFEDLMENEIGPN